MSPPIAHLPSALETRPLTSQPPLKPPGGSPIRPLLPSPLSGQTRPIAAKSKEALDPLTTPQALPAPFILQTVLIPACTSRGPPDSQTCPITRFQRAYSSTRSLLFSPLGTRPRPRSGPMHPTPPCPFPNSNSPEPLPCQKKATSPLPGAPHAPPTRTLPSLPLMS